DEDACVRAEAEDVPQRVDAAAVGESEIEEDHVPRILLHAGEGLTDGRRLAEPAEAGLAAEQLDEPLADDRVIVGHENADHADPRLGHLRGTHAETVVPFPRSPFRSMKPPSSSARSRMPRMPRESWLACAASESPLPLSVTLRVTMRPAWSRVTSTRLAPEWRARLVTAAWKMRQGPEENTSGRVRWGGVATTRRASAVR